MDEKHSLSSYLFGRWISFLPFSWQMDHAVFFFLESGSLRSSAIMRRATEKLVYATVKSLYFKTPVTSNTYITHEYNVSLTSIPQTSGRKCEPV